MAIITKVVEQELADHDSLDEAINEAIEELGNIGIAGVALSISVSIRRKTLKNGDELFVGKVRYTLPDDRGAVQGAAA